MKRSAKGRGEVAAVLRPIRSVKDREPGDVAAWTRKILERCRSLTGSPPITKMMGIVCVAALAARAAGAFGMATITATSRRTNSAAKSGQPVGLVSRPSGIRPQYCGLRRSRSQRGPGRKAINTEPTPRLRGAVLLRNPITGIVSCCARATTGHAAALPSPAMNSRRLIRSPRRRAAKSIAAR